MLSKVMFTLDGLLDDISGVHVGMGFTIASHVALHWLGNRKEFSSPLQTRDWIALNCSALLYPGRLWLRGEEALLDRVLPAGSTAQLAPT
jgi:hypothetical protein